MKDNLKVLSICAGSIFSLDFIEKLNNVLAYMSPVATAAGQTTIFVLTCWYLFKKIRNVGKKETRL